MGRFKIEAIVHPTVAQVADQFKCSICLCLFDGAVQTDCDHIFCQSCLVDAGCHACPVCKTEFPEGRGWRPLRECNKPLQRMMNDIKVVCPNRKVPEGSEENTEGPPAKRKRGAKKKKKRMKRAPTAHGREAMETF